MWRRGMPRKHLNIYRLIDHQLFVGAFVIQWFMSCLSSAGAWDLLPELHPRWVRLRSAFGRSHLVHSAFVHHFFIIFAGTAWELHSFPSRFSSCTLVLCLGPFGLSGCFKYQRPDLEFKLRIWYIYSYINNNKYTYSPFQGYSAVDLYVYVSNVCPYHVCM